MTNGLGCGILSTTFEGRGTENMLGNVKNNANRYYRYYYFYFYLYCSEVKAICDAHEQVPA